MKNIALKKENPTMGFITNLTNDVPSFFGPLVSDEEWMGIGTYHYGFQVIGDHSIAYRRYMPWPFPRFWQRAHIKQSESPIPSTGVGANFRTIGGGYFAGTSDWSITNEEYKTMFYRVFGEYHRNSRWRSVKGIKTSKTQYMNAFLIRFYFEDVQANGNFRDNAIDIAITSPDLTSVAINLE